MATKVTDPTKLISFKRYGKDDIAKDVSPRFYDELRKLLMVAGYHGLFKLGVQTKVPGSPYTKGLRITEPQRHNVVLTWHEGDNGNRIQMSLAQAEEGVDGYKFFQALKEAEKKLAAIEDEVDEKSSSASDEAGAVRPPTETTTPEPSSAKSPPATRERFKDNREAATELFMEAAAKVADETGLLPKMAGFNILREMGFASSGPIIGSMVAHGDLIRIGKGWPNVRHRMSEVWIKRFPPGQTHEAKAEIADTPPPAPATAASTQSAFASLVEDLRRLSTIAKEIPIAQEELRRINEELSRSFKERTALDERIGDLDRRRNEIESRLSSFDEAKAALEDLKSILK